jgi:hypothetical protein
MAPTILGVPASVFGADGDKSQPSCAQPLLPGEVGLGIKAIRRYRTVRGIVTVLPGLRNPAVFRSAPEVR